MPHKHAPKASVKNVDDISNSLLNRIVTLESRLERIEANMKGIVEGITEKLSSFDFLIERVERLEQIYVLVDFVKIENACEQIFLDGAQREAQTMEPALESKMGSDTVFSPVVNTYSAQAAIEEHRELQWTSEDAFQLLENMVRNTQTIEQQTTIHTHAHDISHLDGTTVIQQTSPEEAVGFTF